MLCLEVDSHPVVDKGAEEDTAIVAEAVWTFHDGLRQAFPPYELAESGNPLVEVVDSPDSLTAGKTGN